MSQEDDRFTVVVGWGDNGYQALTDKGLVSNEYCAVNNSIAWEKAIMSCPKGHKVTKITLKDVSIQIQAPS